MKDQGKLDEAKPLFEEVLAGNRETRPLRAAEPFVVRGVALRSEVLPRQLAREQLVARRPRGVFGADAFFVRALLVVK